MFTFYRHKSRFNSFAFLHDKSAAWMKGTTLWRSNRVRDISGQDHPFLFGFADQGEGWQITGPEYKGARAC